MATGLLVQAITLAEVLGANITVIQFMNEQARKNVLHVETVETWLDEFAQISRELSNPDLMEMPAREGMAYITLVSTRRSRRNLPHNDLIFNPRQVVLCF